MPQEALLTSPAEEVGGENILKWLARSPGQTWRALGGVLAFVSFMTIALGYALFLFPVIRALPGSSDVKGRRVRKIIGCSFAGFLRSCTALN